MPARHDWITEVLQPLPAMMTSNEVLGVLRVKHRHLYRLIALGRIHAIKPSSRRPTRLLIPRASLERYLRSLEV